MVRLCLIVVACLCGFSDLLQAQTKLAGSHRKWELFTFGGGSFIGDKEQKTPVAGQEPDSARFVRLRYGSGYQVGIRIGESVGDRWGAELEYSASNQGISFANLAPDIPNLPLSHSIHRLVYDLLHYPLPRSSRLRPFTFVGAGASLFYVNGSSKSDAAALGISLEDRWKVAFQWGGGVKYLLRDQIALRFQASDHVTGVPDYGFSSSSVIDQDTFLPGFRPRGYLHNWLLTFGLSYQWGER